MNEEDEIDYETLRMWGEVTGWEKYINALKYYKSLKNKEVRIFLDKENRIHIKGEKTRIFE